MFFIKLTARPDARMVEVPLDIEVELPREFEGVALLASSGLPRKVKLRAPKDAIKLSTAYRADVLIGAVVRTVLRATQQDVVRVLEASTAFIKTARERRQEGATLLIESDGRGRIEVVEKAALVAPVGSRPNPVPAAAGSAPATITGLGTLADRVGAIERWLGSLEQRLSSLEAKISAVETRQNIAPQVELQEKSLRSATEQLERKMELRLVDLEEQVAAAHRGERGLPLTRTSQSLPTPGAARTGMRRATAVEAFADGLRAELKNRAHALALAAKEQSGLANKAVQVATQAERDAGKKLEGAPEMAKLATEAAARASALQRISEEIELYVASDVPLASQLLERLTRGEVPSPLPALMMLVENAERTGALSPAWLPRAIATYGWKVVAPAPGDPYESMLHELDGDADFTQGRGPSQPIEELVASGLLDATGKVLLRARVRTRPVEEELPQLEPSAIFTQPPPPDAGELPLVEATLEAELIEEVDPSAILLDESVMISEPISAPISEPISDPIISKPIISKPIISEPIVSEPIISEPAPVVAKPEAIASEPVARKIVPPPVPPDMTDPIRSKPAPVESAPAVVELVSAKSSSAGGAHAAALLAEATPAEAYADAEAEAEARAGSAPAAQPQAPVAAPIAVTEPELAVVHRAPETVAPAIAEAAPAIAPAPAPRAEAMGIIVPAAPATAPVEAAPAAVEVPISVATPSPALEPPAPVAPPAPPASASPGLPAHAEPPHGLRTIEHAPTPIEAVRASVAEATAAAPVERAAESASDSSSGAAGSPNAADASSTAATDTPAASTSAPVAVASEPATPVGEATAPAAIDAAAPGAAGESAHGSANGAMPADATLLMPEITETDIVDPQTIELLTNSLEAASNAAAPIEPPIVPVGIDPGSDADWDRVALGPSAFRSNEGIAAAENETPEKDASKSGEQNPPAATDPDQAPVNKPS